MIPSAPSSLRRSILASLPVTQMSTFPTMLLPPLLLPIDRDCAELVAMARDLRALHAEPERRDLAWHYGIGPEILDPVRRTAEIGNWLKEVTKISRS